MRRSVPALVLALLPLLPAPLKGQATDLRPDEGWQMPSVVYETAAYTMESEVLNEERRIFVALPPSHSRTRRQYPLIIVFDGAFNTAAVVASARALSESGFGPDAVIVGIENTDRLRDLSPPGLPVSGNDGSGRADVFLDFLEHELRPLLVERFRAGGPAYLHGHSSGGLFVAYAAATRPHVFGSVLALDAPMHLADGQAAQPLIDSARNGAAGVMVVSVEAGLGWSDQTWAATQQAAPSSWSLERVSLPDETHTSIVWPGSYRGLKLLFADFSPSVERGTAPEQRLALFDSSRLGTAAVPPPEPLLRAVVTDQITHRDLPAAQQTLERLVQAYGESDRTHDFAAQIEDASDEVWVGPTLSELQDAPRASAADAQELVGEWQGFMQMEGASNRSALHLSVSVEDGVAVGAFSTDGAPAQEIEYAVIEGSRVRLGYMNRMTPRGMLVYDGEVHGNVFEGDFTVQGVVFELPGGRELPTMSFRLERTEGGS